MPSTSSRKSLWCLVDCNNFYASCEQIFRPDLLGRPVVVLSNNDGCIIARSKEAKALGIPMGEAWFKVKQLLDRHNAAVFSANFALYGDISNRIMDILERFCSKCEQYSIDEAFLCLDGAIPANLPQFCKTLRETVRQWTGITVSVGVGATPTLAKLANHIAKRNPQFDGLFSLARDEKIIDRWLAKIPVQEIWGIGKGHARKLVNSGIQNALQLKHVEDAWARKTLTVTGWRCVLELRGAVCETTWKNLDCKRKTILHSRSFGNRVNGLEELSQAIATFTARCAERLRAMRLVAGGVWVRARTSVYDGVYHCCQGSGLLNFPTSDTREITRLALEILRRTYAGGYPYAKAGVMLFDLAPADNRQPGLFEANQPKSSAVMTVIDKINQRHGRLTLRFGAMGLNRADWHMRQERRSQDYTTRWTDLPLVSC